MTQSPKKGTSSFTVGPLTTIAQTRVFRLVEAQVRHLLTGTSKIFSALESSDWVNVVALTPEGMLVFIRQYRFGSDRLELEIPGGMVEAGESSVAAGVRELLEETGYQGTDARVIGEVYPNPAIQSNRCTTILVTDAEQVSGKAPDDMEEIETLLLSPEEVVELIGRGEISHGLVLNALMFYGLRLPGRQPQPGENN